nr:tyrosine-type recombinase/integrase [Sporolituus thermophilus]
MPRTFTAVEIKKMLNAFKGDTFYEIRNRCIISLFFSTGIRMNELIELKLQDINITTDLIRIQKGKGMKERFVPISRAMKRILIEYLKHRQEYLADKNPDCPYVFPSRTGQKMTSSALESMFKKLKHELNLQGEKISCHTWRHTFAKNYLLNGGDIFSLQKILGHADLESTRIYLQLNDQEIKTQFSRYNPLDNKDWLY